MEFADDSVVFFNLHERLEVHIRDARRLLLDGQQQVDVVLIEFRAADFPHALADGRLHIQLAVIIAEFALHVAAIRLANRTQPRAQQAGAAAPRKFRPIAHEICPPGQALQPVDPRRHRFAPLVHSGFNLSQRRKGNLLLMGHQLFLLGQSGKKLKPHQRIFF